MNKKYNKRKFQQMILGIDPTCMNLECNNKSVAGHHIIYKSQWSDLSEYALSISRDSVSNGIGLCAECHYKAHNGLGNGQISGREFMFEILNSYNKNTGYYYRWLLMKNELKNNLIRKGVNV